MNRHDEAAQLQRIMACCYAAVQTGFPHLALRHIIEPPRAWLDAKLARQIAIHLMDNAFDMPRRRVTTMMGRQRTSISFAIQAVDRRMEEPVFAAAYQRMAAAAGALGRRRAEAA